MKKILVNKLLILGSFAILTQGCKENVDLPAQNEATYNQVYMPQAVNGTVSKVLPVKTEEQFLVFGANFGGAGYPDNDIKVSFKADASLVTAYNNANNTAYEMMPAGAYQLSATEAIIKKGDLASAALKVGIKTSGNNAIRMFKTYLLPITLSSDFKINERLKTTYFLVTSEPNLANYPDFDRTAWTIVNFSSQEANGEGQNNGRAIFAIDNNIQTFWHSQWQGASPGPPHHITVDMGGNKMVNGVNLTARQTDNAGGKPQEIRIETSKDNITWTSAGLFTLTTTKTLQKKWLADPVEARYLKLVILSSYSSSSVHLAEFGAY